MKNKNLVSIIISTKNEEKNLPRLIKSLQFQSYTDTEIIIVDNYSSDKTKEISLKNNCQFYLQSGERSSQRNLGAQKAKGEYLLFLDADMELIHPQSINNLIRDFEKKDLDAMIIPEINPLTNFWAKCRNLEKRISHKNRNLNAPRFIKKTVFSKIEGYDENLIAAEDYDLDNRLSKNNFKIDFSQEKIFHWEKIFIIPIVKKKFYYGTTLMPYLKKKKSWNRFSPFKISRLEIIKNLLYQPILSLGLIFLKFIEYSSGSCGLIYTITRKLWKK